MTTNVPKIVQNKGSERRTRWNTTTSTRQLNGRRHWLLYTTNDTIEMAERRVSMSVTGLAELFANAARTRSVKALNVTTRRGSAFVRWWWSDYDCQEGSVSRDGGVVKGRVMSGDDEGTRVGK